MSTVRDVVTRALRKLGVAAVDRPAEAEEVDVALQALNDLLAGYASKGALVSFSDYESVSDDFETGIITAAHRAHVVSVLSKELAPEFGVNLSVEAAMAAEEGDRALRAVFHVAPELSVDKGLRVMPSQYWGLWRTRSF